MKAPLQNQASAKDTVSAASEDRFSKDSEGFVDNRQFSAIQRQLANVAHGGMRAQQYRSIAGLIGSGPRAMQHRRAANFIEGGEGAGEHAGSGTTEPLQPHNNVIQKRLKPPLQTKSRFPGTAQFALSTLNTSSNQLVQRAATKIYEGVGAKETEIASAEESDGGTWELEKNPSFGSNTNSGSRIISRAATKVFEQPFVAGHMLNAKLGGRGEITNISAITAGQNARHHAQLEAFAKVAATKGKIKYTSRITERANFQGTLGRGVNMARKLIGSIVAIGPDKSERKDDNISDVVIDLGPLNAGASVVSTADEQRKEADFDAVVKGLGGDFNHVSDEVKEELIDLIVARGRPMGSIQRIGELQLTAAKQIQAGRASDLKEADEAAKAAKARTEMGIAGRTRGGLAAIVDADHKLKEVKKDKVVPRESRSGAAAAAASGDVTDMEDDADSG